MKMKNKTTNWNDNTDALMEITSNILLLIVHSDTLLKSGSINRNSIHIASRNRIQKNTGVFEFCLMLSVLTRIYCEELISSGILFSFVHHPASVLFSVLGVRSPLIRPYTVANPIIPIIVKILIDIKKPVRFI